MMNSTTVLKRCLGALIKCFWEERDSACFNIGKEEEQLWRVRRSSRSMTGEGEQFKLREKMAPDSRSGL